MEEVIGGWWDKLISRVAYRGHPEAAVSLADIAKLAPVFFRALGGDPGLAVAAGDASAHGARRTWLERVAGTGAHYDYAWVDEQTLFLPPKIDIFPAPALNRALYLWLIALAATQVDHTTDTTSTPADWLQRSALACQRVLEHWPGLAQTYRQLVTAHLAQRPDPASLPADEGRAERAIRAALQHPEAAQVLPATRRPPWPVALWLHPVPPAQHGGRTAGEIGDPPPSAPPQPDSDRLRKRRGEAVDMPEAKNGLLMLFRAESLFSWAEFIKVNRPLDDDESQQAAKAADDLDVLSVTRDGDTTASRVRFDLDLPSEHADDLILRDGILLPEWHYRKQRLQPDHCRLQMMLARDAQPCGLPDHLKSTARRLRGQLQALNALRTRLRGQPVGDELDLDACVRFLTDRRSGHQPEPALFSQFRHNQRDMASLLLADLSMSTDSWVNQDRRVIDVIRDALFLFSDALHAMGDQHALYGFSSVRRHHVRFQVVKGFDEPVNDQIRGRIMALKPGFYTRMGAAIRQASQILAAQPAHHRLLLVLTDGKPNDLDQYDGRYGMEDTRHAIQAARGMGLTPFCVTIDSEHQHYLPYLFGQHGYLVVSDATDLPNRLVHLYKNIVTVH
ncbi:nitric oxide reductase NorD protein [Chitinivorax tropicus]|uniref:Nitric oxide reductase NorD protein n=1 Tax=Chitinivorax tropicus TaxID=714531 RepID=A0A840MFX9_9PROT|nr:VWA domain-containing protein [Chitinivorax tropicus]MBB5018154.1 nitric oxide reductase NorD protein [Chitinivorax tropicus]